MQGLTKFNFKLNLKVSTFYLEKQKSFVSKKILFRPYRQDKSKRWHVVSQFSRRFWVKQHESQALVWLWLFDMAHSLMFELLNYKIKNLNAKCVDLPVTCFLHLASLFQIFDCLLHHITVGSNPKNKYMVFKLDMIYFEVPNGQLKLTSMFKKRYQHFRFINLF